jgi:hypothetical protein
LYKNAQLLKLGIFFDMGIRTRCDSFYLAEELGQNGNFKGNWKKSR